MAGHVFYIIAFYSGPNFSTMLPFYGFGLLVYLLLWDDIPNDLDRPVFVYVMVSAGAAAAPP